MDGPTEQCQDAVPVASANCSTGAVSPSRKGRVAGPAPATWVVVGALGRGLREPGDSAGSRLCPQSICEGILSGEPFAGCNALVDAGSYVDTCRQDLCLCEHADPAHCLCDTLAEYSRQCAHAGGLPLDWRGPHLCRECLAALPSTLSCPRLRGRGRL